MDSNLLKTLIRESLLMELRELNASTTPADLRYFVRYFSTGFVAYYTTEGDNPKVIPGSTIHGYDTMGTGYDDPTISSGHEYDLTPEQLERAKKFIELGLFKRTKRKTDYKETTFAHRQKRAGSQTVNWVSENDVPDVDVGYYPDRYESSVNSVLVDINKKEISLDASWNKRMSRRPGLKGGDSGPNYVIPSGDVAFEGQQHVLQKVLKHILQVDKRVTQDFKIAGDEKYYGKTIKDVVSSPREVDVALSGKSGPGFQKLFAYHGTSTARWKDIERSGLTPGKTGEHYVDLVKNYSNKNVYLTFDPVTAENYATRQTLKDGGKALVLKVEIPDLTKIVPDEDTLHNMKLKRVYTISKTLGEEQDWSDFSYPRKVKTVNRPSVPIGPDVHFRQVMSWVNAANQTKAYNKDIDEAPEAGPEIVRDAEFEAMMYDIEQQLPTFLKKALSKLGVFAYRGIIRPQFIQKFREYPKVKYPVKSKVMGLDFDTYQTVRKDTQSKMKRFDTTESLIRNLVRDTLREDLASFTKDTEDVKYFHSMDDPTFDSEIAYEIDKKKSSAKDLKRIWAKNSDRAFLDSLVKVHWLAEPDVSKKMKWMINASGKDEVSTTSYLPGDEIVSPWGRYGLILKGQSTLAANSMFNIYSGYSHDVTPAQMKKYASSGVPKRATAFNPAGAKEFILDKDTFKKGNERNEVIVDNWKLVGVVIQDAVLDETNKAEKDGTKLSDSITDVLMVALQSGLPLYDSNMKKLDTAKLSRAMW